MPADTLIARIQQATCEVFGIDREALLSHRRTKALSHARMISMALSRELTNASLTVIGREFRRDHTTVLNAVQRAPILLSRYHEYRPLRAQIIDAVSWPQPLLIASTRRRVVGPAF